jgi:predicted nuclease of predicted toxin-antitoxin system
VERLRQEGHQVAHGSELSPGATDDFVLQQANELGGILITADKDFGEMIFREGKASDGVVLLRLAGLSVTVRADLVAEVLRTKAEELPGAFTVLSPGAVRIRKPPPQDEPAAGTE